MIRAGWQFRITWLAVLILFANLNIARCLEFPSSFKNLDSTKFSIRESAQLDLLAWSRQNTKRAMEMLFKQSQIATAPEVRERCLEILRSLVNDAYLKEGEGYIGIALGLNDEILAVPGDPRPRYAIRVVEVRANTPGQLAGIRLNDHILSLEDTIWLTVGASSNFREQIKAMKPQSNVQMTLLRNGNFVKVTVKLSRRPLEADFTVNGLNVDPDRAEKIAKETYFNRWLSQMKAKN